MEKEYSNWKAVAVSLATATALAAMGEVLFAAICTVIAIGLTAEEAIRRKKAK